MHAVNIRNGVILTLTYFLKLQVHELRALQVDDVRRDAAGYLVHIGSVERYLGPSRDPIVDPVRWLDVWRHVLSVQAPWYPHGALLPKFDETRVWLPRPLSPVSFFGIYVDAARAAGLDVRSPGVALQKGFVIASVERYGALLTARFVRYRRMDSLAAHVPEIRQQATLIRELNRGRPQYGKITT